MCTWIVVSIYQRVHLRLREASIDFLSHQVAWLLLCGVVKWLILVRASDKGCDSNEALESIGFIRQLCLSMLCFHVQPERRIQQAISWAQCSKVKAPFGHPSFLPPSVS
jgi:hypothetical protein